MINGEELKRVRMMRGISQTQLANTLGVIARYVIAVEGGEKTPSEELYEQWIIALYDDATKKASRKKCTTTKDAVSEQKKNPESSVKKRKATTTAKTKAVK